MLTLMGLVTPMVEGAGSGLNLGDAVSQGLEVVTSVFNFMFSNPLCIVLIGLGLVPVGFTIFSAMRAASGAH